MGVKLELKAKAGINKQTAKDKYSFQHVQRPCGRNENDTFEELKDCQPDRNRRRKGTSKGEVGRRGQGPNIGDREARRNQLGA